MYFVLDIWNLFLLVMPKNWILMLYLSKQVNACTMQQHVKQNKLDRRTACWDEVEDLTDCPCLDEKQLISLACSTYKLRLSTSYVKVRVECDCATQINKEEPVCYKHLYLVAASSPNLIYYGLGMNYVRSEISNEGLGQEWWERALMLQLFCFMLSMHVTISRENWEWETSESSSLMLHWSMTRKIQVTVKKMNQRNKLQYLSIFHR